MARVIAQAVRLICLYRFWNTVVRSSGKSIYSRRKCRVSFSDYYVKKINISLFIDNIYILLEFQYKNAKFV